MNCTKKTARTLAALLLALAGLGQISLAQTPGASSRADWKAVEDAMGRSGTMQPDGGLKFSMPRSDLKITVGDVAIKPALALGSWVEFAGTPAHAMVMGDLVLTEDELEPVMLKLQQEGIQQTGIHNHLIHETPRVMYMHIEGHGEGVKMARAVHDGLALSKTLPAPSASPSSADQEIGIDTAQINSILGHKGKVSGGVYQVNVPRAEKITDLGMAVPSSMGTYTALNFQPTGNGRTAITGDFVLLASEVNPVLQALRKNGIQVTALHSHMLNDQPHLLFMHFWANDDAVKLARGLRAALDETHSAGSEQAAK